MASPAFHTTVTSVPSPAAYQPYSPVMPVATVRLGRDDRASLVKRWASSDFRRRPTPDDDHRVRAGRQPGTEVGGVADERP